MGTHTFASVLGRPPVNHSASPNVTRRILPIRWEERLFVAFLFLFHWGRHLVLRVSLQRTAQLHGRRRRLR